MRKCTRFGEERKEGGMGGWYSRHGSSTASPGGVGLGQPGYLSCAVWGSTVPVGY
jgi:hypothetical protein